MDLRNAMLSRIPPGARRRLARIRYFATNRLPDLWYGTRTSDHVDLESLGLAHPERIEYEPASWRAIPSVLRPQEVEPDGVFVDLGCGAGRQVVVAARHYGFGRVIGVDIAPPLIAAARSNAHAVAGSRTAPIELACSDVLDYEIPRDVSVVFMFNPFVGGVFREVLGKLIRHPGPLKIVYTHPREADALLATGRFRLVRSGTAGGYRVHLYETVS